MGQGSGALRRVVQRTWVLWWVLPSVPTWVQGSPRPACTH